MTGQVGSSSAHATAGECEGIIGSFHLSESDFPSLNSSGLGLSTSACARMSPAGVCRRSSFPSGSAAVAHISL